ncbi:MAG: hypothetical protein P8N43_12565 [Alphaproteobacteria bacterium]|nr:hypothetical protein [Alphaproteobacteria bacterium]
MDLTRRLTAIRQGCELVENGGMEMSRFISEAHEESMEIKGAGGTIGYQLVTEIGRLIDVFLKDKQDLDATQMQVLKLHVDALFVVLAQRILGGGDDLEKQVVQSLTLAVRKYG